MDVKNLKTEKDSALWVVGQTFSQPQLLRHSCLVREWSVERGLVEHRTNARICCRGPIAWKKRSFWPFLLLAQCLDPAWVVGTGSWEFLEVESSCWLRDDCRVCDYLQY